MGAWEILALVSLTYSFYNAWPDIVSASARRARQMGRNRAAMDAFARSLRFVPTWNRSSRAKLMLQTALAAFDVGQPQTVIDWCERAIATATPNQSLIMLAHGTAALGYGELGETWNADQHLSTAIEIADRLGNRDQSARFLAQTANKQRKQGSLREAMDNARRAIELSMAARRDAVVTLAECAVAQGRYDDALRMYDSARGGPAYALPSAEQRAQGLFSLGIAATLAAAERPGEIKPHLDHAYKTIGSDPKLRVWCDSVALQLRAFGGNGPALLADRTELESAAGAFACDRSTLLFVYATLPEISIRIGDYAGSLAYLDKYLKLNPDPVWESRTYYNIGISRRALGNIDGARSAFKLANSRRLDTYHGKLASEALKALGTVSATLTEIESQRIALEG